MRIPWEWGRWFTWQSYLWTHVTYDFELFATSGQQNNYFPGVYLQHEHALSRAFHHRPGGLSMTISFIRKLQKSGIIDWSTVLCITQENFPTHQHETGRMARRCLSRVVLIEPLYRSFQCAKQSPCPPIYNKISLHVIHCDYRPRCYTTLNSPAKAHLAR